MASRGSPRERYELLHDVVRRTFRVPASTRTHRSTGSSTPEQISRAEPFSRTTRPGKISASLSKRPGVVVPAVAGGFPDGRFEVEVTVPKILTGKGDEGRDFHPAELDQDRVEYLPVAPVVVVESMLDVAAVGAGLGLHEYHVVLHDLTVVGSVDLADADAAALLVLELFSGALAVVDDGLLKLASDRRALRDEFVRRAPVRRPVPPTRRTCQWPRRYRLPRVGACPRRRSASVRRA